MRLLSLFLILICCSVISLSAQVPFVAIYFDEGLSQEQKNCPGVSVLDTLYVVARNFNAFIAGIEFRVDYPSSMVWLADTGIPPVSIGSTPTGISMGWNFPKNGFEAVVVCTPIVLWLCSKCSDLPSGYEPLRVQPHPIFGHVRATQWPTYEFIEAVGLTASICGTIDTEASTWGRVKALYSQTR